MTAKTILCYGDSNTYGYDPHTGRRFDRTIRWPGKLQLLLGSGYDVIEEGCNGRTAFYTDKEEPWKMGLTSFLAILNSHKPVDLLILMLGTNDLKTCFDPDPEVITNGMKAYLLETVRFSKHKGLRVPQILLIAPPKLGFDISGNSPFARSFCDRSRILSYELSGRYQKLAEEAGVLFLDASHFTEVSLKDSLHLDADGHLMLADAVAKMISVSLE